MASRGAEAVSLAISSYASLLRSALPPNSCIAAWCVPSKSPVHVRPQPRGMGTYPQHAWASEPRRMAKKRTLCVATVSWVRASVRFKRSVCAPEATPASPATGLSQRGRLEAAFASGRERGLRNGALLNDEDRPETADGNVSGGCSSIMICNECSP